MPNSAPEYPRSCASSPSFWNSTPRYSTGYTPLQCRPSLLVDRGLLNLAYRGADPTACQTAKKMTTAAVPMISASCFWNQF